jgi:Leucine-rich repeat (LRR) protein
MAFSSFKKVFSLLSLASLAVLHSSFEVISLSVNDKSEANDLLNWKASFQNETLPPLPSWTLFHNNATNSSINHNTSSIPCSWFGISCNHAGSVIRLKLTNLGLKGMLHEFPYSSLSNLAYVDLSMNELFGAVRIEISHLSKLIYLDLSFNNLSREISPQIGLLANLEVLHLGENQFNGSIPQDIGQLKSLNELSLFTNHLHGYIPPSLGNLSSLIDLYLNNNFISCSILVSLGNLSNLAYLYLHNNQLSDFIPPKIGNLSNLVEFTMHNNSLTSPIPSTIGKSVVWLCPMRNREFEVSHLV